MNPEWIGYLAALLTTVAYIPQAIKVLKNKDTKSISLGMYVTIFSGIALWLVYGILIMSWPIIACNATTLLLAGYILFMKIRCG